MAIEYLLFNAVVFFSSTLGIWLSRSAQKIHIPAAIQAITVVSLPFILMDVIVTNWFWSFNPRFLIGIYLGSVPFEELLFFFTVPWACLLLWENSRYFVRGTVNLTLSGWVMRFLFLLLTLNFLFPVRSYALLMSALLFCLCSVINWKSVLKAGVLFTFIILFLTALFNMYLTSRPIVMYNDAVLSKVFIGTIPIEDFGYGIILIWSVISLYTRARKNMDANLKSGKPMKHGDHVVSAS